MPKDYIDELVSDLEQRLAEVSSEREQLEKDLEDRLGPLREEESRLRRARAALQRGDA